MNQVLTRKCAVALCAAFSLVSGAAFAGSGGLLTYSPLRVEAVLPALPVPAIGGGMLVFLGIALLVVARLGLRRAGRSLHCFLLVLCGVALSVGGGLVVRDATAVTPAVMLDDPAGGSVPVLEGAFQYENTSGVSLVIDSLSPPCADAVDNAINGCEVAQVLASGDTCATFFQCPEAEVCDGLDNDFNQLIDQSDPGLVPPAGVCDGSWSCQGFSGWVCESACVPSCNGKSCGDDGCGGSCGTCEGGACVENQCVF